MPPPSLVFICIWVGWALSWAAAAFWSSRIEARLPLSGAWPYRIVIAVGAILLWHRTARFLGATRLWHVGYDGAYLLAGIAFLGILFTWWGRLHLGALWSGAVTRKEGHRIVDTGPYAVVRHPIYTGLITATLATAAAEANAAAIAGAALIVFGMWLKARIEERFLAAELGPQDYAAYRRRVPMLLPFFPAA
jgi:protein-S-isoprenylcysteine O-methyltransferase Ste14